MCLNKLDMRFKKIDNFPAYQISNTGVLLKHKREISSARRHVVLCRKGVQRKVTKQELMYETFVGDIPEGGVVRCKGELMLSNIYVEEPKGGDWVEIASGYEVTQKVK